MSNIHKIAIICEDSSDFVSIKVIIQRLTNNNSLSFKKRASGGCGPIKRKSLAWAEEFQRAGCDMLIIVHDRDRNDLATLQNELNTIMKASTFTNRYICIPVEELEGWLLSDPSNITSVLKLDRLPKIKGLPETIDSPKEYLQNQVSSCSNGRVTYINTIHNERLMENIALDQLQKKCETFRNFSNFITSQKYS